ncbi:MAG TPA: hypothetical protein VNK43_13515 [Gemmatimonadales bacterium]|nr:hypothetical protein [Gemmatimonadales bacterium]
MSDQLRGVVACHGRLAEALVEAAERISGVSGALVPVSNAGCDRDDLERRIAEAIDGHPAVVFVDTPSGSCLFAALHQSRLGRSVKVVSGVNLAMLLDFVFHRDLAPAAAAERAAAAGCRAIKVP